MCTGCILWYVHIYIWLCYLIIHLSIGGLYYQTDESIAGFQSRVGCLFFLVRHWLMFYEESWHFSRVLLLPFLRSVHCIISSKSDLSFCVSVRVLTTAQLHGSSLVSYLIWCHFVWYQLSLFHLCKHYHLPHLYLVSNIFQYLLDGWTV